MRSAFLLVKVETQETPQAYVGQIEPVAAFPLNFVTVVLATPKNDTLKTKIFSYLE